MIVTGLGHRTVTSLLYSLFYSVLFWCYFSLNVLQVMFYFLIILYVEHLFGFIHNFYPIFCPCFLFHDLAYILFCPFVLKKNIPLTVKAIKVRYCSKYVLYCMLQLNIDLNCVGPLICRLFLINIRNIFFLMIFLMFSLAYFIVRMQHIKHEISGHDCLFIY